MASLEKYLEELVQMFPDIPRQNVLNIIQIVLESMPDVVYEGQLETMVNMLSGNDNATPLFDEATGGDPFADEKYANLLVIFPNVDKEYLKERCRVLDFDDIVSELTSQDGFPLSKDLVDETFNQLLSVLPDADPNYLKTQANNLSSNPDALADFIENACQKNDYPTLDDYNKRLKNEREKNKYLSDFNVEAFLKICPDPVKFYSDPDRKHSLTQGALPENTTEEEAKEKQEKCEKYALTFLHNHFPHLRKMDIEKMFAHHKKDVVRTSERLEKMKRALKSPRANIPEEEAPNNIPLLQEIAYVKHKKNIATFLKLTDENYQRCKEEARKNGLLQICGCCFDDELIPEDCYFCKKKHVFCKDCIRNSVLTNIAEGKYEFPCLTNCDSEFSIPTLQMVLDINVFGKLAKTMQQMEIKRANIEGLETCPFCDYVSDNPDPEDKIFHCKNEDCGKDSCKSCRHVAHIPKRCNEIEYDEDVKMRTYIENKMTEALVRTCWQCRKTFIKESGCNKMTCSCGAMMCYVCCKPVTNYNHFHQAGGCPLYTNDLNKFHAQQILRGAAEAKDELGITTNQRELKFDPTRDLGNFYNLD